MKLVVRTKVKASLKYVWDNFNEDLFEALNPPFPPVRLLRFDGSLTNDRVELELHFLFFKQKWVSVITSHEIGEDAIQFIDEGHQLPFFLSYWKHTHRIEKAPEGAVIIDNIEYRSPLGLSFIFYPVMWLQFLYRKPIYKNFFKPGLL